MRKNVFLLILILLILPILTIISVQAETGKGTTKLYYEMNFYNTGLTIDKIRYVPDSASPNVRFLNISQIFVANFTLQIGSTIYHPNYEGGGLSIRNLDQTFALYKFWERYTFNDVEGTIEISITGMAHNTGTPNQMDDVTVVGHGTGYFESVKILADGFNEAGNPAHKIHIGTIMGWPGLP